ncbi:MAG: hypothetical protein K9L88_10615 [Chromatiaceae bacterium]|nr:hypothetical protein [Chromatiaceae bacterium]
MATLKDWLNELGFDWETGRIIYHAVRGNAAGWKTAESAEDIGCDHEILTIEFDEGAGSPECPRIIAEDEEAIYFPSQYDGATALEKVWKDLDKYLDLESNETPYPSG